MLYRDQNDETLVMLTLAGEVRAYEVLVGRYERAVIAAANTVTHSRYMAEDAAQDAFITAWMKLNILREPQRYAQWVCRIAKNCARNIIRRMHSFVNFDVLENSLYDNDTSDPELLYLSSEEKTELHESISSLPEKVRTVIHLHYFEELSIAEIADRMRTSVGTVKAQLHDGRKRIRKDLGAMNEKVNDTLVERVMKKVEELKLWQFKSCKDGFAAEYNDVLADVEKLPESGDKYHALADVLVRGWWWLPDGQNDTFFERIKEAAILGKNDEVMEFIVSREDSQVYGGARIEFMRDKQIPMLEKEGFTRTLGREWFWLRHAYLGEKEYDKAKEAFDKVCEVLKPSDIYYTLIPGSCEMTEKLASDYKDKDKYKYRIGGDAYELRYSEGNIRYWTSEGYYKGNMNSVDLSVAKLIRTASKCDGYFFDETLEVGKTITGSDGTTLTFISDNETVKTPCGTFDNCQLWVTRYTEDYIGVAISKNYYKSGVGIVKHEHKESGFTDTRVLSAYNIVGGEGLLPLAKGNTWEYADEYNHEVMISSLTLEVAHADDKGAIVTSQRSFERFKYDENSWLDMIQEIRNEYCNHGEGGSYKLLDVSHAVERAEALAKTPMEKAHTKAAASVIRRIMETDHEFNPGNTATGHWNFFTSDYVLTKNGTVRTEGNSRWSFEWKSCGAGFVEALLQNDIYDILQNATKCLWSDEWVVGATSTVEFILWGSHYVKTQIVCEDGGTVTTKAGIFENCLKLSLDIDGLKDGLAYRGGKKAYYFANGVGIVRTESEYCEGMRTAVYELTSYEGTGEGYMPIAHGMLRRYDAIGLTDGYVGAAEYTYVEDDDGNIVIFADRTGIRETPPPITSYEFIQDEIIEDNLWEEKKYDESRMRHAVNNFRILVHFLTRPSRNWAAARKAVEWYRYNIRIVEFLAEDGEIPRAWLGVYFYMHFLTGCAMFGCRTEEFKEEGYRYLERAFELYPKWEEIPDGEELEVGNELIYGGIKMVKGKEIIVLPDGTREPIETYYLFNRSASFMYHGMTAPSGWEWFNPVRDEERFKQYTERAKEIADACKK